MSYFLNDSPPTTAAAAAFDHFVSAGMTPGAAHADPKGSCMIFQTEEVGFQDGWRKQVVCLPCEQLLEKDKRVNFIYGQI